MTLQCTAKDCFFNTGEGYCWDMSNEKCPSRKLLEPEHHSDMNIPVLQKVLNYGECFRMSMKLEGDTDPRCVVGMDKTKLNPAPLPKMVSHKYAVTFTQHTISINEGTEKTFTRSDGSTYTYHPTTIFRVITYCTLHPMDTAEWYVGSAVLHPNEENKILAGCKQAFGDTLTDHWNALDTDTDLPTFKDYFWKAFLKKQFDPNKIPSDFILRVKMPEGTIK